MWELEFYLYVTFFKGLLNICYVGVFTIYNVIEKVVLLGGRIWINYVII